MRKRQKGQKARQEEKNKMEIKKTEKNSVMNGSGYKCICTLICATQNTHRKQGLR